MQGSQLSKIATIRKERLFHTLYQRWSGTRQRMQEITEQQILAMAPNANAAANGRKISLKGGFVRLERSSDDTFYFGECTGSGKNNYITTIDFMDTAAPVIRCSCPSRQFPCKHGLALLYEILGKKSFNECVIPEEILKKREKKQAKEANKESDQSQEAENSKKKAAPKSNKAARTKKLKKQLEGLELVQQMVQDLMKAGLGTMGGTALTTYKQLAKQLGDYYLPGPQRLLNGFLLEMEAFQKDSLESRYETAVEILERLHALTKKSRQYLATKLESGEVGQDDNLLYEELGGIWKLSELQELGLGRENINLMQLSFWVTLDKARNEYIDTGCWADLDTGEISMTYNYRPLKALKYVKQEDTIFGVAQIPAAVYYPGEGNRRVRWDGAQFRKDTQEDLLKLRSYAAKALAPEVKKAKNLLKNTLGSPIVFGLFGYSRIGKIEENFVLEDMSGDNIMLGNMPGMEKTLQRVAILPEPELFEEQVLLGGLFYDSTKRRILLQPLSILTQNQVVRLLY